MRATLAAGDSVYLVDDDRADTTQDTSSAVAGEQDVERFRGGYQNVRWMFAHGGARRLRRIAGAHHGPNPDLGESALLQNLQDAIQRLLEVVLNVVAERLERRDVDNLGGVRQRSLLPLPDQVVNRREKRGQGFARPGGGRYQRVLALLNCRPSGLLTKRRLVKTFVKPFADRRVKVQSFPPVHTTRPMISRRSTSRPEIISSS